MEVILLEPVKKLGKVGEIVRVKDGFGRNYLLPNAKAVRATASNKEAFESKKAEVEAKHQESLQLAQAIIDTISGKVLTIIKQAGDDGRLFGSVTSKEIASLLTDDQTTIAHSDIVLDNVIKALGVYEVQVSPYGDLAATVVVNIARTESEAAEALKAFKADDKSEQAA